MHKRILSLVIVLWCFQAGQFGLMAQEFKLLDRTVQVHGFVSQGFVYTNDNNWLTMNKSQGSAAFTDFGLNMSSQITDKFRIGAQGYDRNLGQLRPIPSIPRLGGRRLPLQELVRGSWREG